MLSSHSTTTAEISRQWSSTIAASATALHADAARGACALESSSFMMMVLSPKDRRVTHCITCQLCLLQGYMHMSWFTFAIVSILCCGPSLVNRLAAPLIICIFLCRAMGSKVEISKNQLLAPHTCIIIGTT